MTSASAFSWPITRKTSAATTPWDGAISSRATSPPEAPPGPRGRWSSGLARCWPRGEALERRVPRALRLQLALYSMGGLAICDAIAAMGYKTEHERPSVSAATKVFLVVRAALQTLAASRLA